MSKNKISKSEKELLKLEKRALKEKRKQELKEFKRENSFLERFKRKLIRDKVNKKKEEKREKIRALNAPPKLSLSEELFNSITHGVGALFGALALVLMLLKSKDVYSYIASFFYGVSIIFMMVNSCLYHSFKSESKVKALWRRFDYLSIYTLIGGTFAPLFLIFLKNALGGSLGSTLGLVLFCVQWGLIVFGITMVSIYGAGRLKGLYYTLYFVLGWIGILFIPLFIKHNINLLYWILGGGVIYTLGMIPFAALKNRRYGHVIWHFFVLAGCVAQWLGIYFELYC